jgi:STE24 endopeptidase
VALISGLLELPFSIYRTFVLEQRFGFNRTTPGRFVADLLLQGGVMLILGGALLAAILWVVMTLGSWWWLAGWLVWMAFSLVLMWLYPTLIAPLFNKFSPMQEGELKGRIQGLLERTGFRSKGLFVMDGSRRSSHGNAYFTGMGKAKRIVFYDTLLKSLSDDEVEAVLAHELGHFHHKHIRHMLILSSLMMLGGFALAGWLMLQSWFYQGLGISSASQASDLLVLMLVLPVFTQFLSPLMAGYQRRHEFQADDFAAAESGAKPMINALVKLYRENAATLTPDPLYSAFHHSHPPAPVRIAHLARASS